MALTITGIIESIIPRKKENGEIYARLYQIKVETQGGYKKFINIDDFDLNRKIEVGKEITMPCYCDIWQPAGKDGILKAPVLQYHAIKEDASKQFMPNKSTKAA